MEELFSSNDNNYDIRCPKCFFPISLDVSQKQNCSIIIIICEYCGREEMSLEKFDSTMRKNNKKICRNCCKNFETKTMLLSIINHESFLCQSCFQKEKSNNDDIDTINYMPVKDIDIFCKIHKNEKNRYICMDCNRHICQECQKKHEKHIIKNIMEECISKFDTEKMNHILKEENEKYIKEIKLYNELISNIRKKFLNAKKNNDDILAFKKILFDIYDSNSHNYGVFKYTNLIMSDKNYGFPIEEIIKFNDLVDNLSVNNSLSKSMNLKSNNINNLINSISNILNSFHDINNQRNNLLKNSHRFDGRKYSKSAIKESNKNDTNINLDTDKSKRNLNDNNNPKKEKPSKCSFSTCKVSKIGKKKQINFSDLISSQIQRKEKENLNKACNISSEKRLNNNTSDIINNENNKNMWVLKKLANSVINMLYLGENKILMRLFSRKNDLIIGEIKKGKNINRDELISLEILPVANNFSEPLKYMELCEDGSILSFSKDQIIQFKLINKDINIILNEKYEGENNPIRSCISLTKDKFLVLTNANEIHFYKNGKVNKITKIVKNYIIYSMNKISSNYIILLHRKSIIDNKIWLFVMKVNQNEIEAIHEKVLNTGKIHQIKIQRMFDNYVGVAYPGKGFFIYDYLKNHVVNNVTCHTISVNSLAGLL